MSWPSVRFEELYSEPSRNGVYKRKQFHGAGVRIVNMGELFAHDVIANQDMKRLAMADAEMARSGLADGDLLFGRRSLVEAGAGKCSVVEGLTEPTTFESSIIRIRVDAGRIRPRFVFYWLKSHVGRGRIRAIVTGTNVKGIKSSVLKNVQVPCPPVEVQDSVVDKLRAYDDLIENNRRRIRLLERAARLLYAEWFVHLRFPGHAHVTIIDGVPEGWEKKPFSELASFLNGFAFKPSHLGDVGLPIVKIPELRDGPSAKTPRNTGEHIPKKYLLGNGDILFSWSGTLLVSIWNHGGGLLNQHLFKVTPASTNLRGLVYFALGRALAEFRNQTTGATMKHIRRDALEKVVSLIPPPVLLGEFEDVVSPTLAQISVLQRQTTEATKARDLLLPRLMKGEAAV